MANSKRDLFIKRRLRVRNKLRKVNAGRPRLSVHRSSKNISVQLIDDVNGVTLAGVISDGGFTVPRGVLAVNAGSSGFDDPFVELFLRVHHMSEKTAAVRFDHPEGGTAFEMEPLRTL